MFEARTGVDEHHQSEPGTVLGVATISTGHIELLWVLGTSLGLCLVLRCRSSSPYGKRQRHGRQTIRGALILSPSMRSARSAWSEQEGVK